MVYNKNKKDSIEKFFIKNKLIETLYKFYFDFFDINIERNNAPTSIVFIPYLLFNNPYQGFNKFLELKEDNYFSFIKFPHLYILPEKYIYNENIPDISKFQLKILSKLFISNYIGSLIIEKSYADFWIINGLENWLSNLFLKKLFNHNHIKIKIYKWLLKLKKEYKNGKENLPMYSNNFSNPIEIQLNPIFYLKSKIIFHILEQKYGQENIKNILKETINERVTKGYNISTEILIEKFKKYGNDVEIFFELFIYKTGIPEINLSYNYDSENNLIEYELLIENISKKYYAKNPFFAIGNIDNEFLKKIGKDIIVIDPRVKANETFNIDMNLEIVERNGIEIKIETHKLKSEIKQGKYILSIEPKKSISEITQIEKDFFYSLIENTGINQVYTNKEIEEILSQNLILWVSIDSKLSFLRINKIKQQHILNDYIRLYRDEDSLGKFESLYNIGKDSDNYAKSLEILKYFIKNNDFDYQIRKFALKIFVKIIIKLKKEEEYLFLLNIFEDYLTELLKDIKSFKLDLYYFIKEIIKFLGEYKGNNIDKKESTSIKKKIIDKFLSILTTNELDNLLNFDNCYFISDMILICSRLNLGEKSFILMDVILKILRIEKLKRSFNEILIIASILDLNNLIIKYNFFCTQNDIKFKEILSLIFFEINFFMNNKCENYELIVVLHYFHIFMEFYKSQSYIEFSDYIIKYILGDDYNNVVNMSNFSLNKNLNMISKIKALNFFIANNNLIFDSLEEKTSFLVSLKIILYSPICYLREDCRSILENLYQLIFLKEISPKGAGNKNFNNINFLHLLNKNRLNFSSKKYADKDWLSSFFNENDFSIKLKEKITEYNKKYKNVFNYIFELEIKNKISFNELLNIIINKIIEYSNSQKFLGDLFDKEKNKNIISDLIDFGSIKDKFKNKFFSNFKQFNEEIKLIFDKSLLLNEKNEIKDFASKIEQLKKYYEIIIFKYQNFILLGEKNVKDNQSKIEDKETIHELNENTKNEKLLNKKRKINDKLEN